MFKQLANKRSLMGLLYAFVLGIPLLSVLVRTCYVTFNKNAYQSYSDSSIQNLSLVNSTNLEIEYESYLITYEPDLTIVATSNALYFHSCTADFTQFTGVNYGVIGYRIHSSGSYIYLFDENNTQHNVSTTTNQIVSVLNGQTLTYKSGTMASTVNSWYFQYYLISYKTNSLDNVFEYSLQKVTQNNNIGGLNLVNWFGSLFLDINNAQNLLYLNFLNWYFNYVLMVSCVYLLFAVLMWFVNLARRLLGSFDTDRRL